jgi:hypothetical protein
MRYREIIEAGQRVEKAAMRAMMDKVRAFHEARTWPEIVSPSSALRAELLYKVECHGLTVHALGQAFAEEHQGRRMWCRKNCTGPFSVEPIRGPGGPDVDRIFRFSVQGDAALFREKWC